MDKRRDPRFIFKEAVLYQLAEETPGIGSLSRDLSKGGVRLRVFEFIPLGTVMQLKLHFNNPMRTVPVKGQVTWIREVPLNEAFDVGIRFLEPRAGESAIDQYINSKRFQA